MPKERSVAAKLAQEIKDIASASYSEEDLRINVTQALDSVLERLEIAVAPRFEKTAAFYGGRADAVYGHLIIEYEKPRKLNTKPGIEETLGDLKKNLLGEAARYGEKQEEALRRMVGVSLDGYKILFLRYTRTKARVSTPLPTLAAAGQLSYLPLEELTGGFQIDGPHPVNFDTVTLFLTYLRALRRLPLTPEALTDHFGPNSIVAPQVINALYRRLLASQSPKVETFFREWERIFGIVYGQELGKAEKDALALARLYRIEGAVQLKPLLFAVHTYYALLMKLLVAELLSLQPESYIPSFISDLPALADREMKERLAHLEDGGHFVAFGIQNFLEGDFFGWYLADWDEDISEAIRETARQLSDFEPATPELEPEATRDLLKKLYQYLVPKKLRHHLGEYYTPDWLAERLLNQVGYDGNPDTRLLDPACGSGTFLALAINRIREYVVDNLHKYPDAREVVEKVLKNIVGFDLNPLAVIAARTTYLLALGNLRRAIGTITIPVYMCDSILTPTEYATLFGKGHKIPTTVGEFLVPKEVVDRGALDSLATLIEECVRDYSTDEFIERVRRVIGIEENGTETALIDLFEKVKGLEEEGRNRIWARILKNAFAPIFQEPFDYVVGNPPWVNWTNLAGEYRNATQELWERFRLFPHRGLRARLGSGMDDISVLMAYVSMDEYLKPGGTLGFVITQSLFQSKGGGQGFRRFRIGEKSPLKVLKVDDLVQLQPFEGANNRTSIVVLQKDDTTTYPVGYTVWRRKKGARITVDLSLEEVESLTKRARLRAKPIDDGDVTSPWIITTSKSLKVLPKVIGRSRYRARVGTHTWANGIYWVRVIERRPDGLIVIENLPELGRKEDVKQVQAAVESDLLYPLLRGRDADSFCSSPSIHALIPQDPQHPSKAYDESLMKVNLPNTYAYLRQFEPILKVRSGYRRYLEPQGAPFYSIYNVGGYTFAPYKTVWKEISVGLKAAVISTASHPHMARKVVVPDHKLTLVGLTRPDEAHFLCALLNCVLARYIVQTYTITTQISTHILEHVGVPKYDGRNSLHRELALLSQRAHGFAAKGEKEALKEVGEEMDRKAAGLWDITGGELKEVTRLLEELS